MAPRQVDPDLPMTDTGMVYHLNCRSQDVADKFILVGDPGRVSWVGTFLDEGSIRFTSSNREINLLTGTYKGVPVTVLSTGMGTDNVEIVINEIHLLLEYDYEAGEWRKDFNADKVRLIRVGTCGTPRPDAILGALAITRHAIGMDNTCLFYEAPAINHTASVKALEKALATIPLGKKIGGYATRAHPNITASLVTAAKNLNSSGVKQPYLVGTTASGSGFYGCQGRAVGRFTGALTVPNLVNDLGSLSFPSDNHEQEQVVNIEMENSALCFLSNCLGYHAGTICAVIAVRAGERREFLMHEQAHMALKNGITVALEAIIA